MNNHLLYFSDQISPLSEFCDDSIDIQNDTKRLFLSEDVFSDVSNKPVQTDSSDQLKIVKFSPNQITIQTNTTHDQFLAMLQTRFKGWEAYIDNNKIPIYTSNFNYRTLFLPKGKHTVKYVYSNQLIIVLYIISNVLFVLLLLYLLNHYMNTKIKSRQTKLFLFVCIIIAIGILFGRFFTFKDHHLTTHQYYDNKWPNRNAELIFSKKIKQTSAGENSTDSIMNSLKVNSGDEYVTILELDNKGHNLSSFLMVVTAQMHPESYINPFIVSDIFIDHKSKSWHAWKLNKQIEDVNQWNDIIYYRYFHDFEDEDILKAYIWNNEKQEFKLKNVIVNIYEPSHDKFWDTHDHDY